MSKSRIIVFDENGKLLIGKTRHTLFDQLIVWNNVTKTMENKNSVGYLNGKTVKNFFKDIQRYSTLIFTGIDFDNIPVGGLVINGQIISIIDLSNTVEALGGFAYIQHLIAINVLPQNLGTGEIIHYINEKGRSLKTGIEGLRWSFIGGERDRGESEFNCILREFKEETFFDLENFLSASPRDYLNVRVEPIVPVALVLNTIYLANDLSTSNENVFVLKVSNRTAADMCDSWIRNRIHSEVFDLKFEEVDDMRNFNDDAKNAKKLIDLNLKKPPAPVLRLNMEEHFEQAKQIAIDKLRSLIVAEKSKGAAAIHWKITDYNDKLNKIITGDIDPKLKDFIIRITSDGNREKYLKYKAKYLSLKKLLN